MLIATPHRFLVEIVPMAALINMGNDIKEKALSTGGFYTVKIPYGTAKLVEKERAGQLTALQLQRIEVCEGGTFIQAVKELYENLPQDERDAIILHEEGHASLGHLDEGKIQGAVVVKGVLSDIELELQADAYSASRVGKRTLAKALVHVLENAVEFILTDGLTIPLDVARYRKVITRALLDPVTRTRIAALQ